MGLNPASGRPPGGGRGIPLQYSCLVSPMDKGACWATYSPQGRKEPDTTEATQHSTGILQVLCKYEHVLNKHSEVSTLFMKGLLGRAMEFHYIKGNKESLKIFLAEM